MIVYRDQLPHRYEFDDSVFGTEGAVYDLGCLRWEWYEPFAGRKTYIGVDPQERACPDGATLVRAAVAPYSGTVTMQGKGLQAVCCDAVTQYNNECGYAAGRDENLQTGAYTVPAVTWRELTAQYGPAALVKINIEGAEIPLLMSAPQPMAAQMVIAFHQPGLPCSQPCWPQREAITACCEYMSNWYRLSLTTLTHSDNDRWILCRIR